MNQPQPKPELTPEQIEAMKKAKKVKEKLIDSKKIVTK